MVSTPLRIERPDRVPAGVNEAADGIAVGDGPVVIDAYEDFLCPFCRMFEERSRTTLRRLIAEHVATVVYHPLAFLDAASTTAYSSRAASASGCAADERRFADYHDALYIDQPPEGGPGLSDEQLIELGAAIGITDDAFARCVAAHAYLPWTEYVTAQAMGRGVQGTPTILVDGRPVPANPEMIVAAVASLVR